MVFFSYPISLPPLRANSLRASKRIKRYVSPPTSYEGFKMGAQGRKLRRSAVFTPPGHAKRYLWKSVHRCLFESFTRMRLALLVNVYTWCIWLRGVTFRLCVRVYGVKRLTAMITTTSNDQRRDRD